MLQKQSIKKQKLKRFYSLLYTVLYNNRQTNIWLGL